MVLKHEAEYLEGIAQDLIKEIQEHQQRISHIDDEIGELLDDLDDLDKDEIAEKLLKINRKIY